MANVELRWGVSIPMRDGILLSATIYLPKQQPEPAPCVLSLTPYIADFYHDRSMYFAEHGLPCVVVDVRGRGNSQGKFRPSIQEAQDGHDVVEWLAQQPFCNGKVAMRGGSYLGFAQWATAKERPPHLATIVPTAAPYMGADFPMRSNIFYPYLLQWLLFTAGRASQAQIFADTSYWSSVFRRWHESGLSFAQLDEFLGMPSAIFQEWLKHPEPDDYWDAHNPTASQYGQMDFPILTITGSYDDDQPGALEHYRQHLRSAPPAARDMHYLIIGPWDHARTGTPAAEFGELKFGPESVVDMLKLHREWYAWTLQGGAKPALLKDRVAYYVMGAERWKHATTLEAVTAHRERLFLDSLTNADDLFRSGSMGRMPGRGRPDCYTYDPRDTGGREVEAEARASGTSLVDQSVALALGGKALFYHSAPFEADTEISGFFRLTAWIAIDCPDTDFYVSVHEISLSGESIRLSTDAMRARYREGLRTPKLIGTREPLPYDFERFTFVSRVVKRGHRLRLIVGPIGRLVETTFAQKNYNSGGVVARETALSGQSVTVRLFHDPAHPSVLHVPIGAVK